MSNQIQNPNFLKDKTSNQPKNIQINIEKEITNVKGWYMVTVHIFFKLFFFVFSCFRIFVIICFRSLVLSFDIPLAFGF